MDTSEKSSTQRTFFGMLESFKTELPQNNTSIRLKELYKEKPISLHRTYQSQKPMKWPAVIRAAYAAIWNRVSARFIIKAPRGGGKSKLLGTLGFDLWFLKDQNVVNMGGSYVQAEIVYGYFQEYCGIDVSVTDSVLGGERGIKMGETVGLSGNKFSCVTASPKQVRGKHPDALLSDETCETSDELIDSALPMVNDSSTPLVVMASTFHKIFGRFAETWDNAEEMGYYRIQWDIFDVALPFPADIWDRPDMRKITGIDKLKAYAKGRTGDPFGWVRIENIIQAWREKPTQEWFEVEMLGTRPSSAGLVLKPEDVDSSVFDSDTEPRYNYVAGATCVLGIDWGFSTMTAVSELMRHQNDVAALVGCDTYHQTPSEEIIAEVVKQVQAHGIRFIYADSEAKFENVALRNALTRANDGKGLGCAVIEVVFGKEKFGTPGDDGGIGMLGNLRAHFEQKKFKMPKRFKDAYYQLKNYRYQEGTDKPVKKNDHIPDSIMCALQHFKLGYAAHHIKPQEGTEHKKAKPITAGNQKRIF